MIFDFIHSLLLHVRPHKIMSKQIFLTLSCVGWGPLDTGHANQWILLTPGHQVCATVDTPHVWISGWKCWKRVLLSHLRITHNFTDSCGTKIDDASNISNWKRLILRMFKADVVRVTNDGFRYLTNVPFSLHNTFNSCIKSLLQTQAGVLRFLSILCKSCLGKFYNSSCQWSGCYFDMENNVML